MFWEIHLERVNQNIHVIDQLSNDLEQIDKL